MADVALDDGENGERRNVVLGVLAVLAFVIALAFFFQWRVERRALGPGAPGSPELRQQREVDRLTAQVRQIRSNTEGSLFWLKAAGVFVTLGTAVGGYLASQRRSNLRREKEAQNRVKLEQRVADARLDFDHRTAVDARFQAMVEELSAESAVLRTAAAMKLGKLLEAPPVEWSLDRDRRRQLWDLTKQIFAACLAIETDERVLKALTIALARPANGAKTANLVNLDLSFAKAADAYWRGVNFQNADFYGANLAGASLRESVITSAAFREADLRSAVLVDAIAVKANFKLADLRDADLRGADLHGARFEHARVHGVKLDGTTVGGLPDVHVNVSPRDHRPRLTPIARWIDEQKRSWSLEIVTPLIDD